MGLHEVVVGVQALFVDRVYLSVVAWQDLLTDSVRDRHKLRVFGLWLRTGQGLAAEFRREIALVLLVDSRASFANLRFTEHILRGNRV